MDKKNKKPGSRNGKHRQGDLRINIHLDRRTKAILAYTASIIGITLTDLLLRSGLSKAHELGIVDDFGEVTHDHLGGYEIALELLKHQVGDK